MAALALYGALQAVDGVANKLVDVAWVNAPETEKAARFASAEAVRWIEWGLRSYQAFTMGLALLPLHGRGPADYLGSAADSLPDGAHRPYLLGTRLGGWF